MRSLKNRDILMTLSIFFVASAWSAPVGPAPVKPTQESSLLQVEKVWEHVSLDPISLKTFAMTPVTPSTFRKTIVTNKAIQCFGPEGQVVWERSLGRNDRVSMAKNGSAIGHAVWLSSVPNESIQGKITVLDAEGRVLWDQQGGSLEEFYMLDTEHVVEVVQVTGQLILYRKGQPQKVLSPMQFPTGNYETPKVDISEDGRYIAVNAAPSSREEPIKTAQLVLYDQDGNEVLRRTLRERLASEVGLSKTGKYVVAVDFSLKKGGARNFYLFDAKGNPIIEKPISKLGSYEIQFSGDETICCAVSTGNIVYLFDIPNAKLLWEFKDPNPEMGFTSVGLSARGDRVLLGAATTDRLGDRSKSNKTRFLYSFNQSGGLVSKISLEGEGYATHLLGPSVVFDPNDRRALVITPKSVLEYLIKE